MRPFDPRLMKYAQETRYYILFLVVTGFCLSLLTAGQIILIASALSDVFYLASHSENLNQINQNFFTPKLLGSITGIALIFCGKMLLQYLQNSIGHRSALKVIATLRQKVIQHSGNLGERWLANDNTSQVATLTTRGLDALEIYFVAFLPQLFLCFSATPVLILLIAYFDILSAIAVVLCIPLIPIFMILIGKMTANYSSQRLATMQQLGTQLLDLISGINTLKALGREQGPKEKVRILGDTFAQKTMQTLYVAFLSGAALEFITTLSTAIVAVEIGFRMVDGTVLLFTGLVIIMLTPEVFKPLREVGTQFHASADGVAAAEQVFTILETPLTAPNGTQEVPDLNQHDIILKNVSVYAPQRATVAPTALNAIIPPGKITVLRGASGSGKSTTVQLLLNLLSPNEGEIYVGDIPLAHINPEKWWKHITWVPQRPAIVPGTILENLDLELSASETAQLTAQFTKTECNDFSSHKDFPNPDSSEALLGTSTDVSPVLAKLLTAADLTGFTQVVAKLPQGWLTQIGSGGVGLSVGQRGRLALTRALLAKEKIVILDEPAAHLDAVSEEYVQRVIQKLSAEGHTVIVVAHRYSLTQLADVVIETTATKRDISVDLAEKARQKAELEYQQYRESMDKDYALPSTWAHSASSSANSAPSTQYDPEIPTAFHATPSTKEGEQ